MLPMCFFVTMDQSETITFSVIDLSQVCCPLCYPSKAPSVNLCETLLDVSTMTAPKPHSAIYRQSH